MKQWIMIILVAMVLQLLTVMVMVGTSIRLRMYRKQLDLRERELDKVEHWLDEREIKLERKLDALRLGGVL